MMTLSSLSSSKVRILAEISEGLINFIFVSFFSLSVAAVTGAAHRYSPLGRIGSLIYDGHWYMLQTGLMSTLKTKKFQI